MVGAKSVLVFVSSGGRRETDFGLTVGANTVEVFVSNGGRSTPPADTVGANSTDVFVRRGAESVQVPGITVGT
jgi:hypothetical protein